MVVGGTECVDRAYVESPGGKPGTNGMVQPLGQSLELGQPESGDAGGYLKWVRDRIRQIVRRRHKRRGIVKGRERIEYPNRWFEAQGFFSLEKAQAKWIQSQMGHH